jgi:hypothetical protein
MHELQFRWQSLRRLAKSYWDEASKCHRHVLILRTRLEDKADAWDMNIKHCVTPVSHLCLSQYLIELCLNGSLFAREMWFTTRLRLLRAAHLANAIQYLTSDMKCPCRQQKLDNTVQRHHYVSHVVESFSFSSCSFCSVALCHASRASHSESQWQGGCC